MTAANAVIARFFWSTPPQPGTRDALNCTVRRGHPACGSPLTNMRTFNWRVTTLAAAAFLLGMIAAGSGTLRAAWEPIARLVTLQDPPKPASANVLSEHEIEALDGAPPQSQAELLLERAINHYSGANDQIAARVAGWRGHIAMGGRLHDL